MQRATEAGDDDRVPRLVPGWETRGVDLSPEEGFLLSRIDGSTPWGMLREMSGQAAGQLEGCLERWIEAGLVSVDAAERPEAAAERPEAAGEGPEAAGEKPEARTVVLEAAPDPGAIVSGLDIDVELQERILSFDRQLDRPYHELLGVAADADSKTIKRAYFKLSKDFHPDRYFRREIGDYAERLDRVFKKIALAYELLMDPTTRAEIAKSYRVGSSPQSAKVATAVKPGDAPHKLSKREMLEKLRRQVKIPDEILFERKRRARELFGSARVLRHQENWNEAASCIRLAIAFDPWTDDYKEAFGEVLAKLAQMRAEKLIEQAMDTSDGRSQKEALNLLEEAIMYRPSDPEIQQRAAEFSMAGDDLEQAREYAERAVELEPEGAVYHLTLSKVLRRLGLRQQAQSVVQTARKLDPSNPEIQEELRRLRQRPGRSSGGMI